MHPFPSPLLLGRQASLIGYINTPNIGSSTWSVGIPTGAQVGDMLIVVLSDVADITGVSLVANGSTTSQYFAAGPVPSQPNLVLFSNILDSTDLGSGVSISGGLNSMCAAVFVFRGPVNISSPSNDVDNVALSNGATASLTGFTPNAQHVANLSILMSKGPFFTASPMVPWQNSLVNGGNASFMWQILDGGYGGQNITWSNVQNMGAWCAISTDMYR